MENNCTFNYSGSCGGTYMSICKDTCSDICEAHVMQRDYNLQLHIKANLSTIILKDRRRDSNGK